MKQIGVFFCLLLLSTSVLSQEFIFVNAAWGIEECQNEICGDVENPSSFWMNGENANVCMQLDGENFSKNFVLMPYEEFPTLNEFQNIYQTLEGYTILINGFYNKNEKVLVDVHFYYEGFLIGILNHPIIF